MASKPVPVVDVDVDVARSGRRRHRGEAGRLLGPYVVSLPSFDEMVRHRRPVHR
ncbi:MAG: hypothetical protein JWR81_3855 [Pseudonocardia sp.]|jgi:hypothetical protein|nr:hypothetical protein [Pseudonocardia sp.]MDT7615435.1 hypothetical protein [Pseudonocardiales bacterium]